jgi:hypothetical protein
MVINKPALSQMLFHDTLGDLRRHVAVDHRRHALYTYFYERFGEA